MDPYSGCFHDFCLYCDTQATEGVYCSESCRVADFNQALPLQMHMQQRHVQQQQQQQQQQQLYIQPEPSATQYSQPPPRNASRTSSLSSTPSSTASSAPATLYLPSAPQFESSSSADAASSARTSPPSPTLRPVGHYADARPTSSAIPLSPLDTSAATRQSPPPQLFADAYSPFAIESAPGTAVSVGAYEASTHAVDIASYLAPAARLELQRYDDALAHARRRRHRTLP